MPFLAAISVSSWILIGISAVGTYVTIQDNRKNARRIEEQMRRSQEAADNYSRQEVDASGIGVVGGVGRDETKTMIKSAKAPRNVVIGVDRVSGPIVCFFSKEVAGRLYHQFGVVLASHECDAIEAVYFNEDELTLDANNGVIAPAKYTQAGRPLFYIEKNLGAPGQVASPLLVAAAAAAGSPQSWDASRVGAGICYLAILMEADWDVLHAIGIPNVSARVRGVKTFDPRNNLTYYNTNPALLARWWLVDSGYCPKTLASEIDIPELIASANVCDEAVQFSATTGFWQRYAANGVINTTANPLENLNKILGAMDGSAIWVSGKWKIMAGYYRAPVMHIDESKLGSGGIAISPYTPTANLFNAISGQYKGPATQYQPSGYGIIAPTEYLAEDGGQLYEKKDDFDLVNHEYRCQMIAWQRLTRARQQLAINIDCNLKAYDAAPLQNVTLSLAEFGYSNKVFEIRRRQYAGAHIEYSLQETAPEVWAWDYTKTNAAVSIPNVNIPVVLKVAPLDVVSVLSGTDSLLINKDGTITSRIKVTWAEIISTFVRRGGHVEWQYRTANVGSGVGAWLTVSNVSGTQTECYISPVEDGVLYELRGRAVSQLGTRGPATSYIQHTVIGKTEPPPDVQNFDISGTTLSWDDVNAFDLAGYELRFNYGNNTDWDGATLLSTGLITENPFEMVNKPIGLATLMVKAVDRSDNRSLNQAVIITNLLPEKLGNLFYEYRFHPLFAGTLEGCFLDFNRLNAIPSGAGYEKLQYTSGLVLLDGLPDNCTMQLPVEYEGDGLTIEYRKVGAQPFFKTEGEGSHFSSDPNDPYFGPAGEWLAWPGQVAAKNDGYNFRFTLAAGAKRVLLIKAALQVLAPPLSEKISNFEVSPLGQRIFYSQPFTKINNVQATLQAGTTSARTVEVSTKIPFEPYVYVFDADHALIGGAFVDLTLEGY
jgi:hypothetical protein